MTGRASNSVVPFAKDHGEPDIRRKLSEIAGQLQDLIAQIGPAEPVSAPSRPATDRYLLARARELYGARRFRKEHFPEDLFAEPAWDILLDLYIATLEKRRISVTSACIGADVPPTTGLRWLQLLEKRGLVARETDERDLRRCFVKLSKEGLRQMDAYLAQSAKAHRWTGPARATDGGEDRSSYVLARK
ncbi:hypothetical protein GCM10011371_12520 [Novosphingobium marinum]|uniref:MarR family transcriptional regulator n=1 Tax=Novosphingobium marinum TaxID=1514948 RepID=A0A7Z0BSW7_9SPHN|nr:hypothetical protein [Novosphingobium marinum]NYH95361.1 hypothetical protein [Novosphingobium marinum]GGC26428.1 hypothetical protein GCM10011371_12520 [Novosphingobium marinum]